MPINEILALSGVAMFLALVAFLSYDTVKRTRAMKAQRLSAGSSSAASTAAKPSPAPKVTVRGMRRDDALKILKGEDAGKAIKEIDWESLHIWTHIDGLENGAPYVIGAKVSARSRRVTP